MNRFKNMKKLAMAFMLALSLCFALAGCSSSDGGDSADEASVTTKYGTYVGVENDNGVKSFKGIPYAKQPVGDLRWKEAQPLEESNETIECTEYGNTPVQVEDEFEGASLTPQGEDCLTANVWTKDLDAKKPVMVWIYGGGNTNGGTADPMYDCMNMAENNDVVMVSFNYRVGVFGFLDLSEIGGEGYEHSRNVGVLDQIAALKWVKENIASFGGDPENVTVFGESAGGSAIMRLMSTEQTDGLFQKAIIESGGDASILHMGETPSDKIASSKYIAQQFLKITGAKDIDDLLALSAEDVEKYSEQLSDEIGDELDVATWGCTPDGYAFSENVFDSIADGAGFGVDIMIGTNKNELNYFYLYDENLDKSMEEEFPDGTTLGKDFSKNKEAAEKYIEHLGDDPEKYIQFGSEYWIIQPSHIFADLQTQYNNVYVYEWDWNSKIDKLKAAHATELAFVFGNFDSKEAKMYNGEGLSEDFSKQVQAAWVNFATSGNPSVEGVCDWPKYELGERMVMTIDEDKWEAVSDPDQDGREYLRGMFDVKAPAK